jgi:hypothetical protein
MRPIEGYPGFERKSLSLPKKVTKYRQNERLGQNLSTMVSAPERGWTLDF